MLTARTAIALLALATLGACSDGAPPPESGRKPPSSAPLASESPASTGAPGRASGRTRFRPGSLELELRPVAGGFEAPLLLTHAGDGSRRRFVVEQTGRIWILRGRTRLQEPFLDVSGLISAGGERGLLGLAFSPEHEADGRFFINYTDANGDTVVARYEVSGDRDRADPDSALVLLRIDQPFPNHNGGHLAFGPDGNLYIATGDGGSGGDPQDNGQRLDTLLGKILRIDVSGDAPDGYAIPADNPFRDRDGARPEIWAYGLRNPWRFGFDERTDMVWIADVGQNAQEEVNRAGAERAGLNYGWNRMEGTDCYDPPSGCDPEAFVGPVFTYGHDEGCSITGGHVYRGSAFPDMAGGYYYADYCAGTIWAGPARRVRAGATLLLDSSFSISSFGVDERGELFVTSISTGDILKVVDAS